MTTPSVAGTPFERMNLLARARRTGFSHRVGAFSLLGSGLYTVLGRAFWDPVFGAALALRPSALRGTSGDATMTIPGGAGTYSHPLSERSFLRARHHRLLSEGRSSYRTPSRSFDSSLFPMVRCAGSRVVQPCPIEALVGSASPILTDQGSSYVHWTTSLPSLYIRNIIPGGMGIPLLGVPGSIGVGRCAVTSLGANFA
jgi:hypothetical protein